MVQLIAFLVIVAALVILVLQNLSPVLTLVVLGRSTIALPLSVWLLAAIALGGLWALIIYQLAPQRRAYRPMGQRLSEPPAPTANRFVTAPGDRSQPLASEEAQRPNPYDSDWENFSAPEQWDDWGQQRVSRQVPRAEDAVGDTVRNIESGWEEDDYDAAARFTSRQEAGSDIGWRDDDYDEQSHSSERLVARTYEEGWLYSNDSTEASAAISEPGEPALEDPEDEAYDANYRVIIPPYESKDS
ncbi:MAG: hypothetical protein F6K31_32230 [Symploca sp. SIO2G7]|nr:hypothetical protein [Symploca sp. SIO2G7]